MKTVIITIVLTIAAHQAVGALLESNTTKTIKKHNTQIELALNGELR